MQQSLHVQTHNTSVSPSKNYHITFNMILFFGFTALTAQTTQNCTSLKGVMPNPKNKGLQINS